MKPKEEYLYNHIRKHNNPIPQEQGLYKQDYRGFYLAMDEIFNNGLPDSYSYLKNLSIEYNIPIPIRKQNREYVSVGSIVDYIEDTTP
jgi:hypothetical protein